MNTVKYKSLFLTEADEKINALNKALLGLEKKSGDVSLANDAMRAAHTIKSSAAAMDYVGISHLSHAMEDVLEQIRSKKNQLDPRTLEVLFESVDVLSSAVSAIKKGKFEPDVNAALGRLKNMQTNTGANILNISQTPFEPLDSIKVDVKVLDRLMNLTEELLVEKMHLQDIVRRTEGKTSDNIYSHASDDDNMDNFRKKLLDIKGVSESFNRLLTDLQFNVTQARMVPLGQIFERFPRMVRDLSKEKNKKINFKVEGQEIELDRTIIDRLGEPLIHLLRNAVDHGTATKGNITLSAKRERSQVLITVENDGNTIQWQKVIDAAQKLGIIDKAIGESYARNTKKWKKEIENLIFHPQLSTKDIVTETSGRGVGLSIVKSVIEGLGGSIIIKSSEDKTSFNLILPLTLAIIQALLVRVEDQVFALPFSQIDRSVRVPVKNIKNVFDQEVAVVDDEDIPMLRLDKVFGLAREEGVFLLKDKTEKSSFKLKAELMVIAKKDDFFSVGLVIDEMISEQDIVVKPFKGVLQQSKGFAGITFLGDGRPALILDLATLI